MESKRYKKFKVRFILKGHHQVAPEAWVTHHRTLDAIAILDREFNEDDFVDELAGVEIIGALDEEVKDSSEPEILLHCSVPYGTVELCCGYPKPDTYVRENPKIGRNDPCPCGSGRKE